MKAKKQSEKKKRRFSLWKLFENSQFNVVLSIIIAVLAWLIVSMYVKPETEGTVSNIPVQLDYSAQTLQAMGLDVVTEGDAPTASVRVTGDRAVLGGLSAEDITVYPRLSNVTEAGQYDLELVAVKNDSSATYTIKSVQPAKITVRFATLTQKKFVVETDTSAVKPQEGYILTNAYATPGEVTLTGPEEEIRSVGR